MNRLTHLFLRAKREEAVNSQPLGKIKQNIISGARDFREVLGQRF